MQTNNDDTSSNSAPFRSSEFNNNGNSTPPLFSRSDDYAAATDHSSPDHNDLGEGDAQDFVQKQLAILEYIEEENKKPRAHILPSSLAATPTKALDEAAKAMEERALHDEASVENRSQRVDVYVDLDAMLDSDELLLEQLKILDEIEQNHRPSSSVGTTTSAGNMKVLRDYHPYHHHTLNERPAVVYEHGKIAPSSASSRARDLACDLDRSKGDAADQSKEQQWQKTATVCSFERDDIKQGIQPNSHYQQQHQQQQQSTMPGAVHSNSTPLLKKAKSEKEQDSLACLSNGNTILIRGTQHAYQAIENGTAVTVQCFDCQAVYKVSPSATSLFCVCCNQVSSLELARNTMILSTTMTQPINKARQC